MKIIRRTVAFLSTRTCRTHVASGEHVDLHLFLQFKRKFLFPHDAKGPDDVLVRSQREIDDNVGRPFLPRLDYLDFVLGLKAGLFFIVKVAERDLAVSIGRREVGISSLLGCDGGNVEGLGGNFGVIVELVCDEVYSLAAADANDESQEKAEAVVLGGAVGMQAHSRPNLPQEPVVLGILFIVGVHSQLVD